jgi:hypothetical protein
VLCEECRDELSSPLKLTPEQLQLRGARPTTAALIDLWGRPHRLDATMLIGRQVESQGLAILEASVSRQHAQLSFDGARWTLRDLGSANGTYVDDHLVEPSVVLRDGDRIRFGQIAFYFTHDATRLPVPKLSRTATATLRPPERALADASSPAIAPASLSGSHSQPPGFAVEDDEEHTDVGLPAMTFRLHEPTGGGGGLVEVDGKQVQLTTTQFELMALMIRRMAQESHQPDLVRGFVRSSELIADLSWDTREPSENHVKQLVRRVRRALIKSEIGDLIESRHRFGYRLRAIPRMEQ